VCDRLLYLHCHLYLALSFSLFILVQNLPALASSSRTSSTCSVSLSFCHLFAPPPPVRLLVPFPAVLSLRPPFSGYSSNLWDNTVALCYLYEISRTPLAQHTKLVGTRLNTHSPTMPDLRSPHRLCAYAGKYIFNNILFQGPKRLSVTKTTRESWPYTISGMFIGIRKSHLMKTTKVKIICMTVPLGLQLVKYKGYNSRLNFRVTV
jgi:hypothetical protein